jgi:hypothetical protein
MADKYLTPKLKHLPSSAPHFSAQPANTADIHCYCKMNECRVKINGSLTVVF